MLTKARYERRPLRWVSDTAGFVCFEDDRWPGRRILLPAEPTATGMQVRVLDGQTLELRPEWDYWVDGHQDDLVVTAGTFVLWVQEDQDGYTVMSVKQGESHWIDVLATRLPHVRPAFVEEVKAMSREELQRRVLIGSDWQGAFACSLDGIPEISCMAGSGIDGCRGHREIRAIVTQLVAECPKTWAKTWTGKMKEGQAK